MTNLPPCDVVIAPNRSVYVNGTLITNVSDLDVNFGQNNPVPMITLEFTPTSLVYGDVPNETIDAMAMDQRPDDGTVNISRAIARAQARAAGLDPLRHVAPAPTPAVAPAPVRKAVDKVAMPNDEERAEYAEPMDEEACGSLNTKGNRPCIRPAGHVGAHRAY